MKITIRNLQKTIPVRSQRVKRIVRDILAQESAPKSAEISLCFIDDKEIRRLNLRYLGKDRPTDVLAFDLSGQKERILADIFISAQTAAVNAKIFDSSPLRELYLYVIHGILHILGYDDRNRRDRQLMRRKEKIYLKKWLS